jgi:glutamate--cysteine ligase
MQMIRQNHTPSARVLKSMREQQLPFFKFAMHQANKHHAYFNKQSLTSEQLSLFELASRQSKKEQQQIETGDTLTFEQFLHQYFSQNE